MLHMLLRCAIVDSYIVINKQKEFNYKHNVSLLLNRCRDYKTIVGQKSQLCIGTTA